MKRIATLILVLLACDGEPSGTQQPPPVPATLNLELVASGLSSPVYLTSPANDQRLFVVEQGGRIRIIRNGQVLATPFLDIQSRISAGGERGLLSMAFHPNYATNGQFFVNYTDLQGHTRVERFTANSTNPDVADVASGTLIIMINQPFANHNGGLIKFGPDGMLWIGMGDGGSGGDPQNHGQDRTTLLGDMLRIDVNSGSPYAIPGDNPYRGSTTMRPEIWAYGLRNPWRFSFDRTDGMLYIADVGQGSWEEINAVRTNLAGVNYGWRIMEGAHCFNPSTNCNQTGLTLPVHEYDHSGENCSVTGGYVYRGTRIPGIVGHYFYADYCAAVIRSFRLVNGQATDHRTWTSLTGIGPVSSFGEDAARELYVVSHSGRVHRIIP